MPMCVFKISVWPAGVCEQWSSHLPNTRWGLGNVLWGSVAECLPKYAKTVVWI